MTRPVKPAKRKAKAAPAKKPLAFNSIELAKQIAATRSGRLAAKKATKAVSATGHVPGSTALDPAPLPPFPSYPPAPTLMPFPPEVEDTPRRYWSNLWRDFCGVERKR